MGIASPLILSGSLLSLELLFLGPWNLNLDSRDSRGLRLHFGLVLQRGPTHPSPSIDRLLQLPAVRGSPHNVGEVFTRLNDF